MKHILCLAIRKVLIFPSTVYKVTIGESVLDRQSQYFALIAYLEMLFERTQKEKDSYLQFFEGWYMSMIH